MVSDIDGMDGADARIGGFVGDGAGEGWCKFSILLDFGELSDGEEADECATFAKECAFGFEGVFEAFLFEVCGECSDDAGHFDPFGVGCEDIFFSFFFVGDERVGFGSVFGVVTAIDVIELFEQFVDGFDAFCGIWFEEVPEEFPHLF